MGARLGLGSVLGLGSGSRLRTTSVRRCEGADVGSGVFPVRCRGARVACVVVWSSVRGAAALAFAVALRMRAAGRGGSEDEVEEVDEAEDEEEVVDAGWAVMRAGLRAAASAATTAGRMEGMSSGCRLAVRLGGPGRDLAARSGQQRRGREALGCGLLLLSLAGPGSCNVRGCVGWCPRGGTVRVGCIQGPGGGGGWVFWGVCGGRGRATGWGGRAAGRGAPLGGCVWVVECGGW